MSYVDIEFRTPEDFKKYKICTYYNINNTYSVFDYEDDSDVDLLLYFYKDNELKVIINGFTFLRITLGIINCYNKIHKTKYDIRIKDKNNSNLLIKAMTLTYLNMFKKRENKCNYDSTIYDEGLFSHRFRTNYYNYIFQMLDNISNGSMNISDFNPYNESKKAWELYDRSKKD